jgi:hypothetical protein
VRFCGTATVVKRHKRLHIIQLEGDQQHLYAPPDFLDLPDREGLKELARKFTEAQRVDIAAIIEFESSARRKK